MGSKRRQVTEGVVYVFSLPPGMVKADITYAIDTALHASRSGRILGSGISLFDDGTITIEISSPDCEDAESTISRSCKKMKCLDYEVVWP